MIGFVWTPPGFSFEAESNFQTLADWITAIKQTDNRIYVFPEFLEVEAQDEETQYQTFGSGAQIKNREGKPGIKGTMDVATCVSAKLRGFNGQKGRIFIFYESGVILGTSSDGVKVQGLTLNNLEVEKRPMTDNATLSLSKVMLRLNDATEKEDRPVTCLPTSWSFADLYGLLDVDIVASSPTVAGLVIDVTVECSGDPLVGLVKTDVIIKDSAGATKEVTTLTDNTGGNYTVALTLTAGDYTVTLASAATLSIEGYESSGEVSFTVPAG
ncbi:MAG: hypothetical protein WCT23_09620 [Candidatus Neomarinimicrobiota bacterium]